MINLNIDAQKQQTYDVIVIGSGISGGWAAKEFAEQGLKTLVLERGRKLDHITDYPHAHKFPWEFDHRNQLPLELREKNPIASKCYAFYEGSSEFFAKDLEQPYIQEKPFDWIRGYQVGGRSLLWARQTQRLSDFDFKGPVRDGFAVDWPIRYKDIRAWYGYVEKFIGVSGNKDGIPQLPDGEFLSPHEMNCVEKYFKETISKNYKDRKLIIGRCAHLTNPKDIHLEQGRGKCMNRDTCERGCPHGGYFSSNASTLPWAAKTGNMTLRPNAIVHSIIYDEEKGNAKGVRAIDADTKQMVEFYARVIFLNAGALNTNLILLNSVSNRFPIGFGNDNGLLGKYVAFHNYRANIYAEYDGFKDLTTFGRRPNSCYIPRFRNIYKQETDFLRGYAVAFWANRTEFYNEEGLGLELKSNLNRKEYGKWSVRAMMMGETIPKESNYVDIDKGKLDPFGLPQLKISVDYDENDEKMIQDFHEQFTQMFSLAGFTNIVSTDSKQAPGLDVHEMGGVRMGRNPKTSLLNKWNQLHNCKNVFVTDGACMTSTSTQNPSLTYMALTARAAHYAIRQMKMLNL